MASDRKTRSELLTAARYLHRIIGDETVCGLVSEYFSVNGPTINISGECPCTDPRCDKKANCPICLGVVQ